MSVFHPFVHDGDDDFGITCRELPCVGHIDVGSGHRCSGNGLVGIVDVMPLPEKIRVVEIRCNQSAGLAVRRCLKRIGFAVGSPVETGAELYFRDFGDTCESLGRLVEILFRCEPEHIPSVKPCRTGAGLVFAGFGEDALQRGDMQVVQDVIDGFDARTGQRRTGLGRIQRILFETGNGFFAKFYDERTGHGVVRRIADFVRSLDFGSGIPAVRYFLHGIRRAGGQQQGGENQEFRFVMHISC